jgi:hypothetical protein
MICCLLSEFFAPNSRLKKQSVAFAQRRNSQAFDRTEVLHEGMLAVLSPQFDHNGLCGQFSVSGIGFEQFGHGSDHILKGLLVIPKAVVVGRTGDCTLSEP